MSIAPALANRLYMASAWPAWRRFRRASRNPAVAQHRVLMRILRANAHTAFGTAHGFSSIRSVEEYRTRVPVRTYEDMQADIARMERGESGVLTAHPLVCFEVTGGSSGANKLLPYTRPLLREFAAATLPWVYDMLRHRPALRGSRAYWAVTPPARPAQRTATGIPIGLDHDADYFPAFAAALLDRVLGVPRALADVPDVDAWRYLTLRSLLALDDLAFVSVWSPSFLTLLVSSLDASFDLLLRDMERGALSVPLDPVLASRFEHALPAKPRRARELRRRFGTRPPDDLGLLWRRLSLISCWTDAHAARMLPVLRERFPGIEIQGKGLLATEGVVSFPLFGAGGSVAAVTSHYLEFLPDGESDWSAALGVEALEPGRTYEVLLTTSAGLYRYRLHDRVRVEGFYNETPVLSFRGRANSTSDLAGEKLTPEFAEHVLQEASRVTGVRPAFAMLAPSSDPPLHYDLILECEAGQADRLAHAVEDRLATSAQYALCRRLGQLDRVRAVIVQDGARRYERACVARGQRLSAIKPAALGTHLGVG